MITPDRIKSRALNCYNRFLKAWITGNSDFFPLDIPSDKGKSTDPFIKRKQELEILVSHSKLKKPSGYSLEIKEINTRKDGIQSMVSRIYFASEDDFLSYIGKTDEVAQFRKTVALIRKTIPQLEDWLGNHTKLIIENLKLWPELLEVCLYFMKQPQVRSQPRLYIRELPIPVHTKFIEENRGILRRLLDHLLPGTLIDKNQSDFEKRFSLKTAEAFIRFRSLDPGRFYQGFSELALPVPDFEYLEPPVKRVVVIENKMTYLTFPVQKKALAVWGSGFGIEQLKGARWLSDMEIFYWGDIDTSGFEILSAFRSYFPQVCSILMDMKTWTQFSEWAVAAPSTGSVPGQTAALNLTSAEREMYEYLILHPGKNRLEQERIRQDYVVAVVNEIMGK